MLVNQIVGWVVAGQIQQSRDTIDLACGVRMPEIRIAVDRSRNLVIGDETTGKVTVGFQWNKNRIQNVNLHLFFYYNQLTPAYRAALALATDRSPPHVFMLLIDEVVYRLTIGGHTVPGMKIKLRDAVDLDKGGDTTPFCLRGRSCLWVRRNSRFLECCRGYGYYVTFGYWPRGTDPSQYMRRAANFSRSSGTWAPGDLGYPQARAAVTEYHELDNEKVKTMPPVLPPLGPDQPFRTPTLDAFYTNVLVAGTYGRASGRTGTPAVPSAALLALIASQRQGLPLAVPPPPDTTAATAPPWTVDIQPKSDKVVVHLRGPRVHVAEVTAWAEVRGQGHGLPVEIQWMPGLRPTERLVVAGSLVTSHLGSAVPDGGNELVAAGYHILGRTVEETADLIERAGACAEAVGDRVVMRGQPQFAACHDVAEQIGSGERVWIRDPPGTKRHRNATDEDAPTEAFWNLVHRGQWTPQQADRARFLLERGARTVPDPEDMTGDNVAITAVIEYGHWEILDAVIAADAGGASDNVDAEDISASYDQALVYAADQGHLGAVQSLVEDLRTGREGAAQPGGTWYIQEFDDWLGDSNSNNVTPLVAAAFGAHGQVVEYLLDQGLAAGMDLALAVALAGPRGFSPETVNRLIQAGAQVPDTKTPILAVRMLNGLVGGVHPIHQNRDQPVGLIN
jgi:hypothetical protein